MIKILLCAVILFNIRSCEYPIDDSDDDRIEKERMERMIMECRKDKERRIKQKEEEKEEEIEKQKRYERYKQGYDFDYE